MGWLWGSLECSLLTLLWGCVSISSPSLLLNNTDSFTTHFLYLHRDKYAAPNSTHKTRENPCLIYLSKIHFLFSFFLAPLKILIPLLSFLSSPLFLPNEKTTHLGSNWKAKLIKPTTTNTTTTTTKVAVLVVAPHFLKL